jgi:cardiolipin synthase A/B
MHLHSSGPIFLSAYILGAGIASLHALLTKPDPRSALSWIAVCGLIPYGGVVLYALFGINRVRRPHRAWQITAAPRAALPPFPTNLAAQVRVGDALTRRPLESGNVLETLHDGEEAFPRMLETIAGAQQSVWLSTYIFQTDRVGRQFVDALAAAVRRQAEVRVLVDGIGEWYNWPHVVPILRRAGVRAERFLPPRLVPPSLSLNCRNHRKILVVDSSVAYIGGMNLGGREVGGSTGRRMSDIHFRLRGPIVAQLAEVFADDWLFATGEALPLAAVQSREGNSICRAVSGGPDEDVDNLLLILLSAVTSAERQVQIMTPYFIPPLELVAAFEAAALRGVDVCLVLPRRSNLRYIDWATLHWIPALVRRGVRVHLQPPPFSHAKLFVIDGAYAHVGSVNVDTRSLRLNFEIAVEVYDKDFCGELAAFITKYAASAPALTARSVESVKLPERIRNALCWLISPYL